MSSAAPYASKCNDCRCKFCGITLGVSATPAPCRYQWRMHGPPCNSPAHATGLVTSASSDATNRKPLSIAIRTFLLQPASQCRCRSPSGISPLSTQVKPGIGVQGRNSATRRPLLRRGPRISPYIMVTAWHQVRHNRRSTIPPSYQNMPSPPEVFFGGGRWHRQLPIIFHRRGRLGALALRHL